MRWCVCCGQRYKSPTGPEAGELDWDYCENCQILRCDLREAHPEGSFNAEN